jgi:hypothetical protein
MNQLTEKQSQIITILENKPSITQMKSIDFSTDLPTLQQAVLTHETLNANYRFFRIEEIPDVESGQHRQAMSNVLSSMQNQLGSVIYLLSGTPEGVSIYMGIASSEGLVDVPDVFNNLTSSFEGNFLGSTLKTIKHGVTDPIKNMQLGEHIGLVTGIPSFNEEDNATGSEDTQGIERLVNSLMGETWQLVIVAQAVSATEIRQQLNQIYDISTELSQYKKYSLQQTENQGWQLNKTDGTSDSRTEGKSYSDTHGTNKSVSDSKGSNKGYSSSSGGNSSGTNASKSTSDASSVSKTSGTSDSDTKGSNISHSLGSSGGNSSALSRERSNQQVEALHQYITETLIKRYHIGQTKGLFRTAIYVSAKHKAIYDRLANGVLSLFQGNQPSMTPMQTHHLRHLNRVPIEHLLAFHHSEALITDDWQQNALLQGISLDASKNMLTGASLLNTPELALIVAMPGLELPGIKLRKSVNFAVNVPKISDPKFELKLGNIIQHGRELKKSNPVALDKRELNKHLFICGVTGSGKTTTCMNLLLESQLPFMVIEPAKTEYRALHSRNAQIEYYAVGREDITPFRLNPFELLKGEQLAGHISMLTATLVAVFPMEAAMPQITEEAIINAYKNKGWDIHNNENYLIDNPWDSEGVAWPTFSDMIQELSEVIKSKKMGREFEEKYQGSLVARFTNLTLGVKGRMLNTRRSMDFQELLDKRVVIELEEIKDEQDKALLMGLILVRMAESMKQRHQVDANFQHLTLVEEAHRLLSRIMPGDSGSKKAGIEMFANLLAEVRKYGEGLIIADQIPNKLVDDVIKNTNIKIVHRLFAADDRNTIGDTMALSDEQKEFLPLLQPGEAVIYGGGWHAPVWVKIKETKNTREIISEAHIKEQGKHQLWQQRYSLLPHTSRHKVWDESSLAAFMREGGSMLNLLLKIMHSSSGTDTEVIKDKMNKVLHKKNQTMTANWSVKMQQALPEYLADLLVDMVSVKDLSAWKEEAKVVFAAFIGAQKDVDSIKGSVPYREFLDELHTIDSI